MWRPCAQLDWQQTWHLAGVWERLHWPDSALDSNRVYGWHHSTLDSNWVRGAMMVWIRIQAQAHLRWLGLASVLGFFLGGLPCPLPPDSSCRLRCRLCPCEGCRFRRCPCDRMAMHVCERNCVPASERHTASKTTRHPAPVLQRRNARDVNAAERMLIILELCSALCSHNYIESDLPGLAVRVLAARARLPLCFASYNSSPIAMMLPRQAMIRFMKRCGTPAPSSLEH